jgi:hypothetical protein
MRVGRGNREWSEAAWRPLDAAEIEGADHLIVEAPVWGKAGAAGLSFGAFKDFLAVPDNGPSRLLQLEIDRGDSWRFRIEGVLQQPQWWNGAAGGAEDLWGAPLLLKTRWADTAYFGEVALYPLASAPRLTIILTSYRYAQRLRASLANWCRQDAAPGSYEILVVNPGSNDPTHDVIAAAAASFPTVRLAEIAADPAYWRNKGVLINLAAKAARGDYILLTDADCLFASDAVSRILAQVGWDTSRVLYGERRHLAKRTTQAVLAGAIDASGAFAEIARDGTTGQVDRSPWGYAQLIPRELLQSVRYREDVDHYAHTDEFFITACTKRGFAPKFFDGLFCLHLEHPFSWYGTGQFL